MEREAEDISVIAGPEIPAMWEENTMLKDTGGSEAQFSKTLILKTKSELVWAGGMTQWLRSPPAFAEDPRFGS